MGNVGGQWAWVARATAGETEEAPWRAAWGATAGWEKAEETEVAAGCATQQPTQAESPGVEPGEESCPPVGLRWSPESRP